MSRFAEAPAALEDLTPEVVSAALASWGRFPGNLRVCEVRVLGRDWGTTGRARLGLTYEGCEPGPATLFVKYPPPDADQRAMVEAVGMGRREALFYEQVASTVPVRIPQPFFSTTDASGSRYVMLLEDLTTIGATFPTPDAGDILGRARRVVSGLAHLHAAFWEAPSLAAQFDWIAPPVRHELGPALVAQALEQFASSMPPVFGAVGSAYVEEPDRIADVWEQGESTLIHGDCHMGNLFLDGDTVGFLDWALVARGPGIRDVSYFLVNSVPTEVRRTHERALIGEYREQLASLGAPVDDFATLWRRHQALAVYSWVGAAATAAMGDKWQPLEVGKAAMERATAAVADLDSVEILKSARCG